MFVPDMSNTPQDKKTQGEGVNIAIVGSREYPRMDDVIKYVNALPVDSVVVSGGARGVDTVAQMAANLRGLKVTIYPAEWERHGRKAGFMRNRDIVAAADRVVAFWDGTSMGTAHTIRIAQDMGKPLEIHR